MQRFKRAFPLRLHMDYWPWLVDRPHSDHDDLADRWTEGYQPIVRMNETYNGYKLLQRLDNYSWFTLQPQTKEYMAVRFVDRVIPEEDSSESRNEMLQEHQEKRISDYITRNCRNPRVLKIKDYFSVPHHQSQQPKYANIRFPAIVHQLTGVSLHEHMAKDRPSFKKREEYINQVAHAVASLHDIGVVLGDLDIGNIALEPPPNGQLEAHIKDYITKYPSIPEIEGEDGPPTQDYLSSYVFNEAYSGFTDGGIKIVNFDAAFRPTPGTAYGTYSFKQSTSPAPEILGQGTTTLPFRVDSWLLAPLIYCILTKGWILFPPVYTSQEKQEFMDCYDTMLEHIKVGEDESLLDEIPEPQRNKYIWLLRLLFEYDPRDRPEIRDLVRDGVFGPPG